MASPREQAQHTEGVFLIPGLSQHLPVTADDRIRRNHESIRPGSRGDFTRLGFGESPDDLFGAVGLRRFFAAHGGADGEGADLQHGEQIPPPG